VGDLCAQSLRESGFLVEAQTFEPGGRNIIGVRAGQSQEQIVLAAHYDGVPNCAAAADNATGVASALTIARALAHEPRSLRTLVVACFDQEERQPSGEALRGSLAFITRGLARRDVYAGAFVYDTLGVRSTQPNSQKLPVGLDLIYPMQAQAILDNGYRADFVLVASNDPPAALAMAAALERAADIPVINIAVPPPVQQVAPDLMRSDHAHFWRKQLPAVWLTDTANFRNPRYHCRAGDDSLESIDLGFVTSIARMTASAVASSLGR
jgi:Zn-dependent M28 family amino/carboxypeptidase